VTGDRLQWLQAVSLSTVTDRNLLMCFGGMPTVLNQGYIIMLWSAVAMSGPCGLPAHMEECHLAGTHAHLAAAGLGRAMRGLHMILQGA
jgi:hypothetical protein